MPCLSCSDADCSRARRAGPALSVLPDLSTGRVQPERALQAVGDLVRVAPAFILTLADANPFVPSSWPVYVLALAGQFRPRPRGQRRARPVRAGLPPRLSLRQPWVDSYAVDARWHRSDCWRRRRDHRALASSCSCCLCSSCSRFCARAPAAARRSLELRTPIRAPARAGGALADDDDTTGMHSADVVAGRGGGDGAGARRARRARHRVCRAAARHREDRRAQGDHQQARGADRGGVGGDAHPHDRGPANARPGGRRASACRRDRSGLARALERQRLSGRPGRRGHSGRGPSGERLRRLPRDDRDRSYRGAAGEVAVEELHVRGPQFDPARAALLELRPGVVEASGPGTWAALPGKRRCPPWRLGPKRSGQALGLRASPSSR